MSLLLLFRVAGARAPVAIHLRQADHVTTQLHQAEQVTTELAQQPE